VVHFALFDKDHQPRHPDDALEAVDGALEVFRMAKANFYIEQARSACAESFSRRKLAEAYSIVERVICTNEAFSFQRCVPDSTRNCASRLNHASWVKKRRWQSLAHDERPRVEYNDAIQF
jgi:hypothetical protein